MGDRTLRLFPITTNNNNNNNNNNKNKKNKKNNNNNNKNKNKADNNNEDIVNPLVLSQKGYIFRGCKFAKIMKNNNKNNNKNGELVIYAAFFMPRGFSFIAKIGRSKKNGNELKILKQRRAHLEHHTAFGMSQDGSLLCTGTAEGHVGVFSAKNLRKYMQVRAHGFFITQIALTPKNDAVISVSADYSLKIHPVKKQLQPYLIFSFLFFCLFLGVVYIIYMKLMN